MKKKIFSWLSIFFVAALCVGFASCGSDDDDDSGSSATSELNGTWVCSDTSSENFMSVGDVLTMKNGTFSFVQNYKSYYYKLTGKYDVNTETHTMNLYCEKLYKMSESTQDWEFVEEFDEETAPLYDALTYIIDDKTLSLKWNMKSYRATLIRQ